jgi:hypothetical protein
VKNDQKGVPASKIKHVYLWKLTTKYEKTERLILSSSIPVMFDVDRDWFDQRSCERQRVDAFAFVKRYHIGDFRLIDSSDCYLCYLNYSLPLLARQY